MVNYFKKWLFLSKLTDDLINIFDYLINFSELMSNIESFLIKICIQIVKVIQNLQSETKNIDISLS